MAGLHRLILPLTNNRMNLRTRSASYHIAACDLWAINVWSAAVAISNIIWPNKMNYTDYFDCRKRKYGYTQCKSREYGRLGALAAGEFITNERL